MKYLLMASLLFLCACASETEYGKCIGAFDEKDSKKDYKLSGRNLAVAIVFSELVVPPVLVAVNETFCPISNK